MNYDQITVVAIYGHGQGMRAVPALEQTAACLPGCRKLIITNQHLATDIPQKLIAAPLDYSGYSSFCIYALHNFIETDYAFIVQHDGWALSADNWKDDWLEYDYIGGLTHAAVVGDQFYTGFQWFGKPNPIVIQNGGFNLRSQKFMKAPVQHGIIPRFYDNQILNNEDVQLTGILRPALEKVGVKFAPDEEAKMFSFEHLSPDAHKDTDITKIFGHHSRFRELVEPNTMAWKLDIKSTRAIPWELKVYDLFSDHYGYQMVHQSNGG